MRRVGPESDLGDYIQIERQPSSLSKEDRLHEFWKGPIFMLFWGIRFSIMETKKLYHYLTLAAIGVMVTPDGRIFNETRNQWSF